MPQIGNLMKEESSMLNKISGMKILFPIICLKWDAVTFL
jgi:hypothetical protein